MSQFKNSWGNKQHTFRVCFILDSTAKWEGTRSKVQTGKRDDTWKSSFKKKKWSQTVPEFVKHEKRKKVFQGVGERKGERRNRRNKKNEKPSNLKIKYLNQKN